MSRAVEGVESWAWRLYYAASYQWYYHVRRRWDAVPRKVARALPRWLKYWVLIDVAARYSTDPAWGRNRHPMSATAGELLDYEYNQR